MSKQDFMKIQSCVLKVSIHCDGCKQKVRKLLQKIEGVYSVSIDSEQGKVIVSGNVDPFMLIEKLVKSGKHAELWGGGNKDKKGLNNFQNYGGNMKIEKGNNNGGKDNSKSKKNGGQQQVQQVKGFKDLKVKHGNEQKSVKFKLPEEEFDGSDDDFDDEYYDDEFSDDDDDDEFGHGQGHGHGHNLRNGSHGSGNMMNMINRFPMHDKKGVAGAGVGGDGGGGKGKKGDVFDFPIVMKGMGDKNDKKGKGGKKGGGGAGGEKNKKGGNKKEGCKEKHGGGGAGGLISKVVGGLLGHGKNGKGEKKDSGEVGAGGNKNGKGGKKGGGKTDGGHEKNKSKQQNFHEIDVTKPTKGGSGAGGKMGFMDQMGGQMGRSPAVQGLPAQATTMNGGGYYQGMGHGLQGMPSPAPAMMPAMGGGGGYYYQGMGLGNPYSQNQQQQYMGMMMNQQMMNQQMMNQQMMMDGRAHHQFHPHPAPVNYGGMMAAPPQQHPMADPYTHYFSDENTGSCNIM